MHHKRGMLREGGACKNAQLSHRDCASPLKGIKVVQARKVGIILWIRFGEGLAPRQVAKLWKMPGVCQVSYPQRGKTNSFQVALSLHTYHNRVGATSTSVMRSLKHVKSVGFQSSFMYVCEHPYGCVSV